MKSRFAFLGATMAAMCMSTASFAEVITADPGDAGVRDTGVIAQATNWTIRIGEQNAPGAVSGVYAFQLPTEMPEGQTFASADLRLQLYSFSGSVDGFNLDLYALDRIADTPALLATDFHAGDVPDVDATLIQDNFMTADTPFRSEVSYVSTTDAADQALLAFLNSAWDGGANAGKYVFLRLSPDLYPMPNGNNAYNVLSSSSGSSGEWPTITYTTGVVPEPASLALTGIGACVLLAGRRR